MDGSVLTLAWPSALRQSPGVSPKPAPAAQASPPGRKRGGRRQLGSGTATSLPAYHQLHLVLSQRIREGLYPPQSRFPSELDLAARYGVSRVTVRRALAMLEEEGLIIRRRGAGTSVAPRRAAASGPIVGEVENLITIGMDTEARLVSQRTIRDAPPHACVALGMDAEGPLVELVRLRLHEGQPFSLTTVYLRPADAALIDPAHLGPSPVIAALEKAGLRSATAEQTISATLADDRSAALLDVPLGMALVRLRRAVFDADGRPLLFQQSLYRPDRYEYHMLLTRESSAGQPRWRHID